MIYRERFKQVALWKNWQKSRQVPSGVQARFVGVLAEPFQGPLVEVFLLRIINHLSLICYILLE